MVRSVSKTVFILLLICLFTTMPALASSVIIQSGCDVFSDPTTESSSIGHVNANQEMAYLSTWSDDDRGMRWYMVDYSGRPGWVPERYGILSTEKSN